MSGMELAGIPDVLLQALPLLILVVSILAGLYPGEDYLAAAITRARRPGRPRSRPVRGRPRPLRLLPRGGLLLASSLAGRAPPSRTQ